MADESPAQLNISASIAERFLLDRGFQYVPPGPRGGGRLVTTLNGEQVSLGEVWDVRFTPLEASIGPGGGLSVGYKVEPAPPAPLVIESGRISAGAIYAGQLSFGSVSLTSLVNGSVVDWPPPPTDVEYYDTLPSAVGFPVGAWVVAEGAVWRRAPSGVWEVMSAGLAPPAPTSDGPGLRCLHDIDPMSHACRECKATGESLETLAEVCTDFDRHEMKLDYMATGEYFCSKCGLTEAQIALLKAPVVAGDEAAREELTTLPVLDESVIEREV